MAGRVAPYVDNTGLVFAYDQSNTVRSYLGEPTTNLIDSVNFTTNYDTSWNAQENIIQTKNQVNPQGVVDVTAIKIESNSTSDNYFGVRGVKFAAAGANHTFSFWAKGNKVYNNFPINFGTYQVQVNVNITTEWKYFTVQTGAGTTFTDHTLHFGGWGTWTDNTFDLYLWRPQLEYKSHATPYVNGTRSATQGLKDLTGRSTIDLSNVSFDSNAQMTFDGTDDFIPLGNLGTIGSAYTLECVFNSTSVSSYRNVFDMNYNTYSGVTGNTGPRLEQTTGQGINFIWSGVTNSNNLYNYTNTISISANRNYHVAFVQDGSTGKMYLDGTLRDSANNTQGYLQTFGDAAIGRGFTLDPSRYFSGGVYIFKIYNRALTASEIRQNFNAVRGRYGI
jgi:hypothetical protein